jgi:hypothetical protein
MPEAVVHIGHQRGAKPLSHNLPLSLEGEGDTGGEVAVKNRLCLAIID